jgi:GTP-binding protein HflX
VRLADNKEYILVDTVGFVSKLPHALVNAFHATLEEIEDADLLVHIVDASYDDCEFRIGLVEDVLSELGVSGKDSLTVYNKIDLAPDIGRFPRGSGALAVSAKRGDCMDALLEAIEKAIFQDLRPVRLLIPYDRGDIVSYLNDKTPVKGCEYTETGTIVDTLLSEADYGRLDRYMTRGTEL